MLHKGFLCFHVIGNLESRIYFFGTLFNGQIEIEFYWDIFCSESYKLFLFVSM